MIGYSARNVFTQRMQKVRDTVDMLVRGFPDCVEWRCHEVARAVEQLLVKHGKAEASELQVVDGHYGAVDHSWLAFWDDVRVCIIDPYSVGRLPIVQLVDPYVSGVLATYRPQDEHRPDIRANEVSALVQFWSVQQPIGLRETNEILERNGISF